MQSKTITRNKIKGRLADAGISQKEIADELEVSRSAVCAVLAGRSTSARIQQAVAAKLNTTPGRLWRKAA